MTETDHPLVSVIIPVYNDPDGIRRCFEALRKQSYPTERFEILAVDNGSTDDTRAVIQDALAGVPNGYLLVEDEIQGSYAARNAGIERATGEVLAFTDADCTPAPTWIESGVKTLEREDADLAGGRVVFEFSSEKTAAERFDASVNMRNDESVRNGVAKTANVFARAAVVEEIGLFPQELISGGDVHWTRAATDAGFELVYAPEAVVTHSSRQLWELLRKQYRVGTGQIQIWRMDDRFAVWILLVGLACFPFKVLKFLLADESGKVAKESPPDRDVEKGFQVIVVAGLCILLMSAGRLVGLFGAVNSSH